MIFDIQKQLMLVRKVDVYKGLLLDMSIKIPVRQKACAQSVLRSRDLRLSCSPKSSMWCKANSGILMNIVRKYPLAPMVFLLAYVIFRIVGCLRWPLRQFEAHWTRVSRAGNPFHFRNPKDNG